MEKLIISTDSTSDISKELAEKYDIKVAHMDFWVGDEEFNTEKDTVESSMIYPKMREWKKTSTSQINEETYYEFFKELIKEDKNVLHIAFSSGLSGQVNNAVNAAKRVNKEENANIYVLDSLCGCAGMVMLGIFAREFYKKAKDINEVADYLKTMAPKLVHRFSVDNLKYLTAGGRISSAAAVVGNLLQIKPIINLDDSGNLVSMMKVISRKKALKTMANQFLNEVDKNYDFCFISHSDCLQDAEYLKNLIETESNYHPTVNFIGPVLGCHCGPGTVAIFFVGKHR